MEIKKLLKNNSKRFTVLLTFGGVFFGYSFFQSQDIRSANLNNVSVTLSTPRLSFVGKLSAGNTTGSSMVLIDTTPNNASSTTSAELAEGDIVLIGDGSTANTYTVASASTTANAFQIESPNFNSLQAGNADTNDAVIATRSGSLTVRFTTASAVNNGAFQILIPASTLSGTNGRADGIPDQDGFDFGATPPSVTCPTDVGSTFNFVSGTATASAITLSGVNYHSYECRYSGSGSASTAFDGSTQGTIVISSAINPSPKIGHISGYADTYKLLVRNLDSSDTEVDSTIVTIGHIESVRVKASVAQQITFSVMGLSSGTTACGQSMDVTTTTETIPFGAISLSAFTRAAQSLSVSTNAQNGFAVTISANDQMGKDGASCPGDPPAGTECVPDATVVGMTESISQDWTNTADKGLGYSLQDPGNTTNEAFTYNETGRTFSAKHLPDSENAQTAQTIFSASSPAEDHLVYACYQVLVSPTTTSGDYQNSITYRATASF